jgi:hypothetical protein
MLSCRIRLLAPLFVACSLLVVGTACTFWSRLLAEEPKLGAILSEIPLVAAPPQGEPLAVMPRVSIAETRPAGEHCSGETHAPAALLAPVCDEDHNSGLVPMPAVPHWSEQVPACPGAANDRAGRFDFLGPHQCSLALLEPPIADEGSAESAHYANDDTRSPWSTPINGPNPQIAFPSKTALEPLSISVLPRRPVAPSGTMYLWSTTTEARAAQGHEAAGTSAGVVLTRPPGVYSIDWVGIAVTAPIQWR